MVPALEWACAKCEWCSVLWDWAHGLVCESFTWVLSGNTHWCEWGLTQQMVSQKKLLFRRCWQTCWEELELLCGVYLFFAFTFFHSFSWFLLLYLSFCFDSFLAQAFSFTLFFLFLIFLNYFISLLLLYLFHLLLLSISFFVSLS